MTDTLSYFFIFAGQSVLSIATFGFLTELYIWYCDRRRRKRRLNRYDLRGKYVLITGASSGLGRSLAREFYLSGSKVILAARSLDKLRELCDELKSLDFYACQPSRRRRPFEPLFHYLDLADTATIEEVVTDILQVTGGRLDILVNNAGMSTRASCEETSTAVHRQLMEVNYFGHVELTRLFMTAMLNAAATHHPSSPGPCIVCISSVQGRFSIPYRSAYAASKHAFQAYFDCLRAELAAAHPKVGSSIRVLVVAPGYMSTNLSVNALLGDGSRYGKIDDTTKQGLSTGFVAKEIVRGVIESRKELIIATLGPKTVIALRPWMPGLYFWWTTRRARKELLRSSKDKESVKSSV